MKKIYSILSAGLSLLALTALSTGCVEEVPEVIEEVHLSNLLTPSSTSSSIDATTGYTVTFTWTNSKAANYRLEVYAFETEDESTPATAEEITDDILASVPDNMKFVYDVTPSESGSTTSHTAILQPEWSLYARVCAQSSADPDTKTTGDSKWAVFKYPIDTYTVMDPVSSVTVTERTENSITISWTLDEADKVGINQVRVSPNPNDPESAYLRQDVQNGNVNGSINIPNLDPSVKYTIAVHYNSANRGEVYAWTRPSLDQPTTVETSEQLIKALEDGASQILVNYSETPYEITTGSGDAAVDVVLGVNQDKSISVYGNGTNDGKMPTIIGRFTIPEGLTSLHLESLNFDGNEYNVGHVIQVGSKVATDIVSISMLNCNVTAYKHGFFYYNNEVGSTANIGTLSFKNIMVSDIQGSGGNGFDIRQQCTIDKIDIEESTFTDGMRTFVRIDAATVNSFIFKKNTLNNLCALDDGNNKGLFYLGGGKGNTTVSTFEMTDNVFLNMDGHAERTVFFSNGGEITAGFPTKMSNNFYYNLGKGFWKSETVKNGDTEEKLNPDGKGSLTQTAGLAGNGQILSSDPCENSARSILNLTSTGAGATILSKGAGDPRWQVAYVAPEEKPLTPVNEGMPETGYSWDFSNDELFFDSIEDSCIIANLQFYVDSNPISVTESGLLFTAEGITQYSGTPVDCAIGFMVTAPGSVVISTEDSGSTNDHFTVAYGPADGSSAKVQGSISTNADRNRVVFPDLTPGEKTMIYIYACGPITMTGLSWISAVETINPQVLASPENVKLSAESGDETSSSVKLTWDAVDAAGGYDVTVTGPRATDVNTYPVDGTEYEFTPSELSLGTYSFTVKATVAEGDMTHDPSEPSAPVSYLRNETWNIVSSSEPTSWGSADLQYMNEITGGEKIDDIDYVYNGMKYLAGNNSISFVSAKNAKGEDAYAFSSGGSGSTEKRALQFKVPGPGTLTFEAISGGTERYVRVYIGGNEYTAGNGYDSANGGYPAPDKSKPEEITAKAVHTLDLAGENIPEGTVISLFSKSSGINFFSVTWTPAGYDPDATIDGVKTQSFKLDFSTFEAKELQAESLEIDDVTYVGRTAAAGETNTHKLTFDGDRIKTNGGSKLDDNGIPVTRYISFKVASSGTFSITADNNNAERYVVVIAVDENGKVTEIMNQLLVNEKVEYTKPVTVSSGIVTLYVYSVGAIYIRDMGYTIN